MPANKKHLNPTFHQRFAKITAGFIGGYLLTNGLFLTFTLFIDHGPLLMTMKFVGFVIWGALMILPFLFKNGWNAWGVYLVFILAFSAILYL